MRKLIIWSVAVLAVAASAAVASAAESKGMTFSIGLSHGSGEYSQPVSFTGADYIDVLEVPEIGANAEFGMAMSDDYAMVLSGDFRFGSLKQEPTTNAAAGSPTLKATTTSYKVRLGGDRTGKIGDRFHWFMGPGLEYASGKAKFEDYAPSPDNSLKSEPSNKFGINGRIGGVMMLSPQVGIKGQIGDTFGMASVKDTGGKTTWYYSSFEAAWGVQFAFGGK
jgi:hypothetical protein